MSIQNAIAALDTEWKAAPLPPELTDQLDELLAPLVEAFRQTMTTPEEGGEGNGSNGAAT